jgi:hypothetical protein
MISNDKQAGLKLGGEEKGAAAGFAARCLLYQHSATGIASTYWVALATWA